MFSSLSCVLLHTHRNHTATTPPLHLTLQFQGLKRDIKES